MENDTRIFIEQVIAQFVIDEAMKAGYMVSVYDGDEFVVKKSNNKLEIFEAMMSTDSDFLHLYHNDKHLGWIQFVYGNNGYDVIADNTTNLEDFLERTTLLADKFEEMYT